MLSKRFRQFWVVGVFLLWVSGAWAGRPAWVEVVILHSTDVHAHVAGSSSAPGWLRLASAVKAERTKAGGPERVLLIDTGDTIQGTLLGTLSQGGFAVAMLDHLKYDAWVLGNHELDYGVARLKQLVHQTKTPVLNGNFTLPGIEPFPAWRLYHKNGVRIAVIGMNTPHLPYWFYGKKYAGYKVWSAVRAVERLLPELQKQKPHMIILAIHQGYMEKDPLLASQVKELAYRFPQLDLILGGHTHRIFPGKRVGGAYYVQPGAHGEFLGKITARVDLERRRVLRFESSLIRCARYKPDPASRAVLADWLERAKRFRQQPVVEVRKLIPATGLPGRDCWQSELVCRAIAWKTGAKVVFHARLSNHAWEPGTLTEEGLFQTIPYENSVGVANLSKAELKEILTEQLRYAKRRTMNGLWGLHAKVDLKARKVLELEFPAAAERVAVAFNSYTIAGGGGRFPKLRAILRRSEVILREFDLNPRDIVRAYLQAVSNWDTPPEAWLQPVNLKQRKKILPAKTKSR